MANLFDYLKWRGDLTFNQVPFGKIDALLLSQISYCLISNLVSENLSESITLKTLCERMKKTPDFENRKKIGYLINKNTTDLLLNAGNSRRFENVGVCGLKEVFDEEKTEQFMGITFFADGKAIVSYRGTDDSFVGWKEDFNISWADEIPAQTDAKKYIKEVCAKVRNKIIVIGHSKGGHLAIAAAVETGKNIQKRIEKVYNFDGPGFEKEYYLSEDYLAVKDRIVSVYPELSIVGMIFYHPDKFDIVKSDGVAVMEHDALTWQICGNDFIFADDFDSKSKFFYKAFNEWTENLNQKQIKNFVLALFSVIEASEAKTNSELVENSLLTNARMVAKYASFDKETKREVRKVLGILREAIHNNSPFARILRGVEAIQD